MAISKTKELRLTADRVRQELCYDPETGTISRRATGFIYSTPYRGYILISVDRLNYRAHRLAWLHFYGRWPDGEIDHINGNRIDNRISNLRECTRSDNACNRATPKGVSGFRGVRPAYGGKWCAYISLRGTSYHLGTFPTREEAAKAYAAKAADLHGAFARVA